MGIGASIFLLAVGAILAFAVTIDPTPVAGLTVQWDTVGVILMVIGAIGLIWSVLALNAWRDRNAATVVEERPVERERIAER
jgi:Na+/melibiose symporter-like transporter